MKTRTLFAALLLSGLCAAAQAGDIYKWVDTQGRVHYSDLPQAGWTRVGDRPGGTVSDPEGEQGGDAETLQQVQQKRRAEDCARKEEQLKTYRNATRIVERDALGREKEYSSDDREKLIAQTERDLQTGCTDNTVR